MTGLAHRGPALFMFSLLLPLMLLTACRNPLQEQQVQGVALGTGYHITLYADLDAMSPMAIRAVIQGELETLEAERRNAAAVRRSAFAPLWRLREPEVLAGVWDQVFHALAVDRLVGQLAELDVHHLLVEVGGVMRSQGSPPGRAWRVSLAHAALPSMEDPQHVRLDGGAVLHRLGRLDRAPAPPQPLILGVAVIASSAMEGRVQADALLEVGPLQVLQWAEDRDIAASIVVKSSQGITIHQTAALAPWLER